MNKPTSWTEVMPSTKMPFDIMQDITPLFYIQQGNTMIIQVNGRNYTFEINKAED